MRKYILIVLFVLLFFPGALLFNNGYDFLKSQSYCSKFIGAEDSEVYKNVRLINIYPKDWSFYYSDLNSCQKETGQRCALNAMNTYALPEKKNASDVLQKDLELGHVLKGVILEKMANWDCKKPAINIITQQGNDVIVEAGIVAHSLNLKIDYHPVKDINTQNRALTVQGVKLSKDKIYFYQQNFQVTPPFDKSGVKRSLTEMRIGIGSNGQITDGGEL